MCICVQVLGVYVAVFMIGSYLSLWWEELHITLAAHLLSLSLSRVPGGTGLSGTAPPTCSLTLLKCSYIFCLIRKILRTRQKIRTEYVKQTHSLSLSLSLTHSLTHLLTYSFTECWGNSWTCWSLNVLSNIWLLNFLSKQRSALFGFCLHNTTAAAVQLHCVLCVV